MTRPIEELRTRYHGPEAAAYEARRRGPQWEAEHAFVAAQVAKLRPRRVLDVPMGTGRFLPIYRDAGVDFEGLDVSADMIAQAVGRGWPEDRAREGSAFALPWEDGAFDMVVCVRFLNWLHRAELVAVLRELGRVCSGTVVVSLESGRRLGRPIPHPFRVLAASGYRITAGKTIRATDRWSYSMLCLRPDERGSP